MATPASLPPRWAKVIDQGRCIGCHACTTACKSENTVPLGVTRTYVKYVDVGRFPQARRAFQVTRCNQCEDPPCAAACPTGAMYRRPDGIVDFDKSVCIGCKACIAACPYDAIFINPEDQAAEKCNFCAHRLDRGLEPACVVVCPTEAILVGDLHAPDTMVARMIQREPVQVRRPEKATRPKLYYRAAHQATLDPLAAERPGGGLFLWSEQQTGPGFVVAGHPAGAGSPANSSAAAMLSYDVAHQAPWGWRVSLYTWTKSIAAGCYLVPLLLVLSGLMPEDSPLWRWAAPIGGGAFLALTGLLLVLDLKRPARFYLLFTRPQWSSWLVRGGFLILGYSIVLAIHFGLSLNGTTGHLALAWAGGPLALATAIYTAWLFAQARARDLWQSPLLVPHLAVQAALAGAGALLPVATIVDPALQAPLGWVVAATALVHLLLMAGEITVTHPTAHARLAVRELTTGRFAGAFRIGAALALAALATPWIGPAGGVVALVALVAWEHGYVQAGQSVPLA